MDEIKPDPNYYAIIPAQVRYDKEISASAKLLYGEISALSNRFGYCCATNGYFSELYCTKIRTVQRWLQQLADQGYIRIEPDKLRRIYIVNHENLMPEKVRQKSHGGVTKKSCHHDKKVTHNNTSNNTFNNKDFKHMKGSTKSVLNQNSVVQKAYEGSHSFGTGTYQEPTNKHNSVKKRFTVPTIQEIAEYVSEKKYNVDAAQFWNHYEARGWELKRGQKMVKWKAAVATWHGNSGKFGGNETTTNNDMRYML